MDEFYEKMKKTLLNADEKLLKQLLDERQTYIDTLTEEKRKEAMEYCLVKDGEIKKEIQQKMEELQAFGSSQVSKKRAAEKYSQF